VRVMLALDVGNTNIALGVYDGAELLHHWRLRTVRDQTEDELGLSIKALFNDVRLDPACVAGVAISCVVPPLLPALERMSRQYFQLQPIFVTHETCGLEILYDSPREVGADRLVNAVAAIEDYGPPLIIVDFGTATTWCVIDERGRYVGGLIAPGIQIAAEALFQRAAKLPRIELSKPPTVVGRNTVEAMQAGVLFGYVGQIEGVVSRIRAECGWSGRVIATGGLAELVAGETTAIDVVDPYLTLRGLRLIWQRQAPRVTA